MYLTLIIELDLALFKNFFAPPNSLLPQKHKERQGTNISEIHKIPVLFAFLASSRCKGFLFLVYLTSMFSSTVTPLTRVSFPLRAVLPLTMV